MKNPEHTLPIQPEMPAVEKKILKPYQKFNILLGMFGTEKARNDFIELCRDYRAARAIQISSADSENYRQKNSGVHYSPSQRATTHNRIMDIISRIATDTKTPTEDQETVLRDFYSREEVAAAIISYFQNEMDRDYYDESEENEKKGVNRRDMSGPAYFHSLGREH